MWLRVNLYTLILIIGDYVGTQPEFFCAVEYPVARSCYHKEEIKWIEGELQVPSWRELPAGMPRSNQLIPPPPAHAGIALSSLPTMLINRLGCQFKHSTKSRQKRVFILAIHPVTSTVHLCLEISISSNSRNLSQFLQFVTVHCKGESRKTS